MTVTVTYIDHHEDIVFLSEVDHQLVDVFLARIDSIHFHPR